MLTNKTKVTRFLNRTETILWWGLPLKPLEAVAVTTVRNCNTTLNYFETEVSLFICLSNREGRLHRLLSERPFCFGAGRCSWIRYRRNLGEEKLVKFFAHRQQNQTVLDQLKISGCFVAHRDMADETDKRLLHSHAHMTFMLLSPGQRGEGWGVLSPKGGWVLLFGQFRSGATGSFVSASLRVPMFKKIDKVNKNSRVLRTLCCSVSRSLKFFEKNSWLNGNN